MRELLDQLQEIAGVRVEPEMAPPRTGDIHRSMADISAARQLLGYEPAVSFAEGLRRTYEWYQSVYQPRES